MKYNRADFDYAEWERQKPYPHQNILVSRRLRPRWERITPFGWFALATLALAALALAWGGL